MVSGPYQVDELCMEHHGTLEPEDFGRWYILVNGSMQFCESQESAHKLIAFLKGESWPEPVKDWQYYANLD